MTSLHPLLYSQFHSLVVRLVDVPRVGGSSLCGVLVGGIAVLRVGCGFAF